jgi:hypothetical protein
MWCVERHTSARARCLNFLEEDEDGGEVREITLGVGRDIVSARSLQKVRVLDLECECAESGPN